MERLQKLLAAAGIASRRHAEEMILAGRVRVNNKVVTELGTRVDPSNDAILVDNQPVSVESKAYYILNKPRGYISDRDDTAALKTALDLVPDGRRLFAAGRLDLMSEGMLLLTNDGELANRLTHPRYEHEKEYLALVFGSPDDKTLERLERGILYDGEWLRADSVTRAGRSQSFGEAGRDETWLRIILHEGKKRQIRHMCAALGHPVKRLIRIRIGPLVLGKIKPGEWRKLTQDEIAQLRQGKERSLSRKPAHPRTARPAQQTSQAPSQSAGSPARPSKSPTRSFSPARTERSSRTGPNRNVGSAKTGSTQKPSRLSKRSAKTEPRKSTFKKRRP